MNAGITVEADGVKLSVDDWLHAVERRRAALHLELKGLLASSVIRLSKSIEARSLVAEIPEINGVSSYVTIERTAHTLGIRKGRNGVYSWQPLLGGHWDKTIRPIYNVHGLHNCDGGGVWRVQFVFSTKYYRRCLNGEQYYIAAENTVGALTVAQKLIRNYIRGLAGLAKRTFHKAQIKLAQSANQSTPAGSDKGFKPRYSRIAENESGGYVAESGAFRANLHYSNGLDYAREDVPELQAAIDAATNSLLGEIARKTGAIIDGEKSK